MQLQTILNHVEPYKSFVYKQVAWDRSTTPWRLQVQVQPRANSCSECSRCEICVERVPWSDGKCHQTLSYRWFPARWAKRLSWLEVAEIFHTNWDTVYRAVRHAVRWGLVHRDESGIRAIGVDEIHWKRGPGYVTLVYQIDAGCRRLLWIGKDRTEKTGDVFRSARGQVASDAAVCVQRQVVGLPGGGGRGAGKFCRAYPGPI